MKGSTDKYEVKGSKPHWRYRLYLGKNPVSGKKLFETKAGFEKEAEAQKALDNRKVELAGAAGKAAPTKETLGDNLRAWLDRVECEPKTRERYKELAAYVLNSNLATIPITDLKPFQIRDALFELLHAPAKRREHLSVKTVRHVASIMRTALEDAFFHDRIVVNPMLKVKLPKPEKGKDKKRSLSRDEIDRLLVATSNDWTRPFIQVGLATGARRGELLALLWTDINWDAAIVEIKKSLEQTREGLRVKLPKDDEPRTFRLPQDAIAALRFQREAQAEHRRLFGRDYVDRGLVFCEPNGDFLDPALVSQTIVRRIKKAGIPKASLHTLRHTHCSVLVSENAPMAAVSARLGHADTTITQRIYTHAIDGDDKAVADAWDAFITRKTQ